MVPITRKLIVASTAFAAIVWLGVPADAQRGGQSGGGRSSSGGGQSQGGGGHASQGGSASHATGGGPAMLPGASRQSAPAPQSYNSGYRPAPPVYRQSATPAPQSHSYAPQGASAPAQRYGAAQYQSHGTPLAAQAQASSQAAGVAGARPAPPYATHGPQATPSAVYSHAGAASGYGYPANGNSYYVAHYSHPFFVTPYYAFHAHYNVGFGIYVGYPVVYPYAYYSPYGYYNYGVGYGYGASYGVGAAPAYSTDARTYSAGSSNDQIGGLSFDIDPVNAAVFIDGQYVGVAADFSSGQMPLTVAAGRHHIELRAQGFMTVSFDITAVSGQVIPYEGTMPIIR